MADITQGDARLFSGQQLLLRLLYGAHLQLRHLLAVDGLAALQLELIGGLLGAQGASGGGHIHLAELHSQVLL